MNTFELPEKYDVRRFFRALHETYSIKIEPPCNTQYAYYDTFDWRLFNKSLVFSCTENHAVLQSRDDEAILCRTDIVSPPVRLADVPAGDLHERLAPVMDIRALLKLVGLAAHVETIRILDSNEKTVLRLAVEQHRLGPQQRHAPLLTRVCLKPVRGYDKAAKDMRHWLGQQGFTPAQDSLYAQALAAIPRTPNDYTSKIRLQLDPMMRADEATKTILRFLFDVMRRNEAGIIQDIDTEFLHDFRVAIRRTRSALGQIKQVFPASITTRFKRDFAYLGTITTPLRDLDVYLLQQEAYQAHLPAHLRDDIVPLFAHLQRQRVKVHAALVRALQTKKYADILARWERFLTAPCPTSDTAPHAAWPILTVARKRIKKKRRAVMQLGSHLLESDDEQMLHTLRIECKKLRYLLEFFASLFPANQIDPLIKHLRKLQDNLGDFHDIYVQQQELHALADQCATTALQTRQTLRAIDSLIGILDGEKHTVRAAFPDLFQAFAACASRTRFPAHRAP